ncbi:MAG: Carbonic anhydrase precursor [Pseudomonadota bacterium]|jgi:carbonic anhydrase|nr:carbonic anhydrase family protein [Betaproteobacteria bacterium]
MFFSFKAVMKKYLRLILEILLGVCFIAASTLAYMNYSAKKHLVAEVGELTEQLGEAKEALEKMHESEPAADEQAAEAGTSTQELDALKAAFSNGVVLQDMELLYKAQKALSPERQVGMASIRLLTKGAQDEGTVAAFQKALEMAEWGNRLQTVCAAQNALAAAGQKVKVLSDCKKSSEKEDSHAKKDDKAHDVHWGYEGDNGPEHWGDNFPVCGTGKKQSPLNITGPFEKSKDVLSVDYKEGPLKMFNNGHTIQVNVEPGSTLTINKETFDLLQFHFHRPSEEQVDGKNSAMVAHFVHKSKDGKLAVIGVLLNEGKDNAAIKTLWANLPPKEGVEYLPEKVSFNPGSMLPKDLGFYNYEGSLTTPPCTEGVQFYILKKPMDISKDQVGKFPFKLNARPVQNLNGRKISAGG